MTYSSIANHVPPFEPEELAKMLAVETKALTLIDPLKELYKKRDKTKKPFFIKIFNEKSVVIMQVQNLSKICSPKMKSWEDAIVWRYMWMALRGSEPQVLLLSRSEFSEEELPKGVLYSSQMGD
jgi:hypothetical protein